MQQERRAAQEPNEPEVRQASALPTSWEQVWRRATPAQRAKLTQLAEQQGCVLAQQVDQPHLAWQVLDQPELAERLPLTCPVELDAVDQTLDGAQRDAVARALATPDICLVQGFPGTGKSRVVAEVLLQANRRGERVLLVAQTGNAIERVLEMTDACPELLPYRLAEATGNDTGNARFEERLGTIAARARTQASSELAVAEQRCLAARECAPLLARLAEIVEQLGKLKPTAAVVASNGNGAHHREQEVAGHEGRRQADVAQLRARSAATRGRLDSLHQQLDDVRKLAEARASRQWWTMSWWRAAFHQSLPEENARLESDCDRARRELDELLGEEQKLLAEQTPPGVAAPASNGNGAHVDRAAALRREWADLWLRCAPEDGAACEPSPEAVDRLIREREQAEQQCSFVKQWLACFAAEGEPLPEHWRAYANPIAGTWAACQLSTESLFDGSCSQFDLAVVQEAEQFRPEELKLLARRARRLVLVGEPESIPGSRRGPAPACSFASLWQRLHADPRRLPYLWTEQQGKLSCRLSAVADADVQYIENESVADHPEIELRILDRPGAKPVLAEVVFPAALGIAEAKRYIQRELDELTISAGSPCLAWQEWATGGCELRFADIPGDAVAIELDDNVRELVVPVGQRWQTVALTFGPDWNRTRAADWVAQRTGLRDLGRTARLDVPHCMHPELARFLSHCLFAGEYRAPVVKNGAAGHHGNGNGNGVQVEFVSVMPLAEPPRTRDRKKTPAPSPARPRKEGAGLELDLADQKNHGRLPAALRPALIGGGFVNYVEAQAVVRTLEAFASDPDKRATLGGQPRPKLAVIALYPAQAALIRRLVEQSPALAACDLDIEIDVPGTFRQRESALVLLSLTRSHKSRAVSFGDSPRSLALALTRARSKLILFGDPGTLICRSLWSGPVDHLDECSAAQERELIAHLVTYLEGQGPCQRAFSLRACGSA